MCYLKQIATVTQMHAQAKHPLAHLEDIIPTLLDIICM